MMAKYILLSVIVLIAMIAILIFFYKNYYGETSLYTLADIFVPCLIGYVNFSVFTKFCKIILTDKESAL